MGIGKILAYAVGGAVVGVAAVAAAPFTGGGSVLGAATLASSLAGAGTIATAGGMAAAGATAAGAMAKKREEEDEERETQIARLNKRNQELESSLSRFHEKLQGTKEYFDFILGLMAFGVAIARVDDGHIDDYEKRELEEFLCGVTFQQLPSHIQDEMQKIYEDKTINLEKALGFLPKINNEGRKIIENTLYVVAEANDDFHQNQERFIRDYWIAQEKIPFQGS